MGKEQCLTYHILISGRVQGVGFRHHCAREAKKLGITGWVRNLSDGRVEVVAEGNRVPIDGFLAWCRQGPSLAKVTEVEMAEQGEIAQPKFDDFSIL